MKKRLAAIVTGAVIAFGGGALAAPAAVAAPAPTTELTSSVSFDVGPFPEIATCEAAAVSLYIYYTNQGYRTAAVCYLASGFPPFGNYKVRVVLAL
ncbi:hypothetical protein ACIQ9P_27190 [Kitasatospora sp. NPDC094019]|uniref:hypothetical protein n=1 Tax=Kitasatospora sp. NPDC094019 TaxID=3364091 RepID=UPI00382F4190